MWSTVTATPFFDPQSFANWSNHLSYSGTKWLHCTMVSVLAWASAGDTNGADIAGPRPAAPAIALLVFRKLRRVTRLLSRPFDAIAQFLLGCLTTFVAGCADGFLH